jgi:hypothetical protein
MSGATASYAEHRRTRAPARGSMATFSCTEPAAIPARDPRTSAALRIPVRGSCTPAEAETLQNP